MWAQLKPNANVDHYSVLGVPENATEAEIRKAYLILARKNHPDKSPDVSIDVMQNVTWASHTLLDPDLRQKYDKARLDKKEGREGGVSEGRVNKEKNKNAAPGGTFFKSQGAPSAGAARNRKNIFETFAQDLKSNTENPIFTEYKPRSRFFFSSSKKAEAKTEAPNTAGNAQSSTNRFFSGHGAKDKEATPNATSNAAPNAAGNAQSSTNRFFSGLGAKDKEATPNATSNVAPNTAAGNTQSSTKRFFFGHGAKDKEATPNATSNAAPNTAGNAQSSTNRFFSGHGTKDKEATPNATSNAAPNTAAAGNTQSSTRRFFFGHGAKDKEATPNATSNAAPNTAGNAQSSTKRFFFGHGAKDKEATTNATSNAPPKFAAEHAENNANQSGSDRQGTTGTPEFGGYVKRSRFNFSFSSAPEDKKATPEPTPYVKRSRFNFSFSSDATNKKETANVAGDAQSNRTPFVFGEAARADSTHTEDLPHKKPSAAGASTAAGTGAKRSTPPVLNDTHEPYVREVFLSLEEVAKGGCTKGETFWRPIQRANGTWGEEETFLSIETKKGWKAGTKVTFGKADQKWQNATRDIVFLIKDAAHPVFSRDGSNLLYTAFVSPAQIKLRKPVNIPTLSGGTVSIDVPPEFVDDPELLKRIKGEGLPFPRGSTEKGDLIVKFVSTS